MRPEFGRSRFPPYRRRDIEREIDLIEEIARLYGYDNFCETLPKQGTLGQLSPEFALTGQLREALRGGRFDGVNSLFSGQTCTRATNLSGKSSLC